MAVVDRTGERHNMLGQSLVVALRAPLPRSRFTPMVSVSSCHEAEHGTAEGSCEEHEPRRRSSQPADVTNEHLRVNPSWPATAGIGHFGLHSLKRRPLHGRPGHRSLHSVSARRAVLQSLEQAFMLLAVSTCFDIDIVPLLSSSR